MPKLPPKLGIEEQKELSLGKRLAARYRKSHMESDDGSFEVPVPGKENDVERIPTMTMADASKFISKVRYLVPFWVALGMLTGVIAEPGIGKSAFVLYALVRVVVCGGNWFNGMKGPSRPGYVLWVGTENDMAITL